MGGPGRRRALVGMVALGLPALWRTLRRRGTADVHLSSDVRLVYSMERRFTEPLRRADDLLERLDRAT